MMHRLAGLDYEVRGAGEAVCLVHAGVFSAWFAPLFEQPALDGFRVIRPIRPGYGRSPAPSEPASIAAHAHRCGALLRGLGVTAPTGSGIPPAAASGCSWPSTTLTWSPA
jgi:pimeloyl-ACP methyl ester carboxylesterase